MRTLREMGRESIAIYSDVDVLMPFARYADRAFPLGGKEARETYLDSEKIIAIARRAGADAVHPGYGFLSENSEFAAAVERAGLLFIGPGHEAIRSMGDKTEARKMVAARGVPTVPGTMEPVESLEAASKVAAGIGYPILVKAAAGGGGKGMRLVKTRQDLESSLRSAKSEAQSAFGDSRVFIEKFVVNPRHIEFQILADSHGNVIHLFERECSIQRRHQKVVEETPSLAITQDLREEMGKAAVDAAKSCGYSNAGTVEFVLAEDGKFYFLEMNTRLQVEHPITELTTGIDLVREQIMIAEGDKLHYSQDEIRKSGHAIECRIYAEDVYSGFVPDTGALKMIRPPEGNWVRVDSGVETGSEISVYYDPMIAKLSTWDATRDEAISKMKRALDEYVVLGVKTTIPFCRFVMDHGSFSSGKYSTAFVEDFWTSDKRNDSVEGRKGSELAAIVATSGKDSSGAGSSEVVRRSSWTDQRFED